MAPALPTPTYIHTENGVDNQRYIRAQWRADNYTASMVCTVDDALARAFQGYSVRLMSCSLIHTTTLANERSAVLLYGGTDYIATLESGDTTDIYPLYGPYGPLTTKEKRTGGSILLVTDSLYGEWTGNCSTWLSAFFVGVPIQDKTDTEYVSSPQPVSVDRIRVWPWERG